MLREFAFHGLYRLHFIRADVAVRATMKGVSIRAIGLYRVLKATSQARIRFGFLVSTIVAMDGKGVCSLVVSRERNSTSRDACYFAVVVSQVACVLGLATITRLPRASLRVLFFGQDCVFDRVAIRAITCVEAVEGPFRGTVRLARLFRLRSAWALYQYSVGYVGVAVFLFGFVCFPISVFRRVRYGLPIFDGKFTVMGFLRFVWYDSSRKYYR